MKKTGFTLAEVLITLTVVGIVAALATPALNNSVQKSKVGPSIRKIMTTMSNVNQHILAENDSNTLSNIVGTSTDAYIEEFKKYAKGVVETKALSDFVIKPKNINGDDTNGPLYGHSAVFKVFTFESGDAIAISLNERGNNINGSFKGNIATIWYDMNGFEAKPNRAGKDEFKFVLDDNGTIYPDGGRTVKTLQPDRTESALWWSQYGWGSCNEKNVKYGTLCGASVVDNNYKVIYKY